MTKRLISLMLAVLMLAFALTSCGNDDDALGNAVNNASRYTSTINLWMVTESKLVQKASHLLLKGYDPDKYPEDVAKQNDEQKAFLGAMEAGLEKTWRQLDDICDQVNVLTKKRFKTQVNIRYYTEDEYYTNLEAAFRDMAAAKVAAQQSGTPLFPEVTSEETVKNDHGVPELKYPVALDAQTDVVFVGGAQNYYKYAQNGWLMEIGSEDISNSAPQLNYHLTSALLSASKYNTVTYAIPNNNPLGEYTYLAVDTALVEEYKMSTDAMNGSLYSDEMKQFLDYVHARTAGEKVYPIYSESGKLDLEMIHYWSFNENYEQSPSTFSLFGGFYTQESTVEQTLGYKNVFAMDVYTNQLAKKTYYENTANYITRDASAKSAVRVVKGNDADKAALERMGYTVLTTSSPRITDEDVFGSMFAVGAITRDKNRNLEIIAMLNTEPEIRNLLQYGIEDVNYTLKTAVDAQGKELGVYAEMKAENMYEMDLDKTGNMFVAYPNAATTDLANGKYGVDAWENAKKQNLVATPYPTMGLNFSPAYKVDDKSLRILNAVSAQFKTVVVDTITTEARVQELKVGATNAEIAGPAAMAEWILNLTGAVTYVPAGETAAVAVTADDLTVALTGLSSGYSNAIPAGTALSTKTLYDEWWLRTYAPKQSK